MAINEVLFFRDPVVLNLEDEGEEDGEPEEGKECLEAFVGVVGGAGASDFFSSTAAGVAVVVLCPLVVGFSVSTTGAEPLTFSDTGSTVGWGAASVGATALEGSALVSAGVVEAVSVDTPLPWTTGTTEAETSSTGTPFSVGLGGSDVGSSIACAGVEV